MVVKPSDEKLAEFCSQFNFYAIDFGLDNELRAAAFLAQVFSETGYLQNLEENLNYPAAILSAMWFWKEHRLNQFADMGDIDAITRDITGNLAEAENRKRRYIRVLQLLAISY